MKKWFSIAVCALTLVTFICLTNEASAAESCKSCSEKVNLFQGKTIDDFDFFLDKNAAKSDVFSLNDKGVLSVKGNPFGWIGTKKEYRNFVLNVEFRYPDKSNTVNSGIFIRVNGTSGMFLPKCVEIQLCPKSMGDLYGFWDMKLSGSPDRFSLNEQHKMVNVLRGVKFFKNAQKDDLTEWHTVNVLCCEDLLVVRINGKVVNWANGVELVSGKIAFQSEGAPIEFRNAVVTEIK